MASSSEPREIRFPRAPLQPRATCFEIQDFLATANRFCQENDLKWCIYPRELRYLDPKTCREEKKNAIDLLLKNNQLMDCENLDQSDTVNDVTLCPTGVKGGPGWDTHGRIYLIVSPWSSGNRRSRLYDCHVQLIVSYPGKGSHDLIAFDPNFACPDHKYHKIRDRYLRCLRDGVDPFSISPNPWPRKVEIWTNGILRLLNKGWLVGRGSKKLNNLCTGRIITGGPPNMNGDCLNHCREFIIRFLERARDQGQEAVSLDNILSIIDLPWSSYFFVPTRQ
ncbi:hypothetical protein AA313_de0207359 [Arthrobotrys entomopaga]|nr:hypothetical protein AA313_de0207359 [Arthrobotrys entomopaga]